VNALACRIRDGRAEIGSLTLTAAAYNGVQDASGTAFVRPHDLLLARPGDGVGALAEIVHISVLGALVRVELLLDGQTIEAELSRQRHAELGLALGQAILVWPSQARFFLRDSWQGTSLHSPGAVLDHDI
jgi:sulfate transport system ATP-binding protein